MEEKKKRGKVLFVSSISSVHLHCTSEAPSLPSPLVSRLGAALMQEVCTRGPRYPTYALHTAQKCTLMACEFYSSKCFGDPVAFSGRSSDPFLRSEERRPFKQVVSPGGSLDLGGGRASVAFAGLGASGGTGRARSREDGGSGDEWRVSQVLRLSPG